MMNPYVVGSLMVAAFCGIVEVILLVNRRRKKEAAERLAERKRRAPTVWLHVGRLPPKGVHEALRVIVEAAPGLPDCGTIDWVDGPYELPPMGRVAGHVVSFDPTYIRVTYFENVEQSALAHELGHVWRKLTGQSAAEPAQDPEFGKWIATTNAAIRKALGR